MKAAIISKLAVATLSVALAVAVYADEQGTATTQQSNSPATASAPSSQADSSAPIAGATPLAITIDEEALVTRGWRVSELLHADVYNDKKQKIGKIDDLIVAPDGSLSVAIIDVGGFLGIGRHHVAIPVQQLRTSEPKRLILTGATKDALLKLPEFHYLS